MKMFTLTRKDLNLNAKWWHRLLKSAFILFLVLQGMGLIFGLFFSDNYIFYKKHNISIITNLEYFTQLQLPATVNTVPAFIQQEGKLGLLNGNDIDYLSAYSLENALCSPSPLNNIEKIVPFLYNNFLTYSDRQKFTLPQAKDSLISELKKNPSRVCFIPKEIGKSLTEETGEIVKSSDKIIKFKPNVFYYFEMFGVCIAVIGTTATLLMLFYYKVFLYIIFGAEPSKK